MKINLQKYNQEKPRRSCDIRGFKLDEDARTVELSFSSEVEAERFFGIEILGHRKGEVDLDWLNKGTAPLLLDHNPSKQVGVIESARIDKDGKARAVVRFSKSAQAEEVFQDVKDGIRANVSVGYNVGKFQQEKPGVFRAVKWTPHEISIVSLPVDQTVGVGRGVDDMEETMDPNTNPKAAPETRAPETSVNVELVKSEAMKGERARISTITELGQRHNQTELANKAVADGTSVDSFRANLLAAIENKPIQEPETDKVGSLDLSRKEQQRYSLRRGINALITGDWKHAGFERECSLELARQMNRSTKGLYIPNNMKRATQTMTTADDLVPQIHRGDQFIDILRDELVLAKMGATILSGLSGIVHLPRLTAGVTVDTAAENTAATEGAPTYDTVTLTPHVATGNVPYSRTLLYQADPSIDDMLKNDIMKSIMVEIEKMGITGTGSTDVTGVLATSGINTQTFATSAQPTFAEIVGMEKELLDDKALMGSLGYLITGALYQHCKTTPKDDGSGFMILNGKPGKGELNGYDFAVSSWMTAATAVFGNWKELIIALFGAMEIVVDQSATTGEYTIGVFQDYDVAVRHPVSFCKGYTAAS